MWKKFAFRGKGERRVSFSGCRVEQSLCFGSSLTLLLVEGVIGGALEEDMVLRAELESPASLKL